MGELKISELSAAINELVARWGMHDHRAETTVVSSAPEQDDFSFVPRHVVQARRIVRAVDAGGFQDTHLDTLRVITELAREPRTEVIGRGLFDLIKWDEPTRPRVPSGLDVLARRAAEVDVDGWRQTLRHAVSDAVKGVKRVQWSERILRKIVWAVYPEFDGKNIFLLFDDYIFNTSSTHLDNWLFKLSDLRSRSLIVLLDQGQTDLVRRLLRVIEVWRGRPNGIVDVLIHTAALVPQGDTTRIALVSGMMDLVEEQAELPQYFDGHVVGRKVKRDAEIRNEQLIGAFNKLIWQFITAPEGFGRAGGRRGGAAVPPDTSTPPTTPETPPPQSTASRFGDTDVMATPAYTWMMVGQRFAPPPAVSMTIGAAWMTASRPPTLAMTSSPAIMRLPGALRTPVMQV